MSTVLLTASPELHARVMARVEWCVARVNDRCPVFTTPEVYYFSGVASAGVATLREHRAGFMLPLLEQRTEDMIEEIVPHEVAHLAVYHLYLKKLAKVSDVNGHGRLWQKIMRSWFGVEPRRALQATPEIDQLCGITRQRRWEYTCACEGRNHLISTRRHNAYKSGKARYRCTHCKTPLIGPWNT